MKQRLTDILQQNDTIQSRQMLKDIEDSFTNSYEYWFEQYQQTLNAIVFETSPTYNEFCQAMLARFKWYFSAKYLEPLELALPDIYTLACRDIQSPNTGDRVLLIKDKKLFKQIFKP
jgi:hypothetical protein